jgi:hypothetical protein
MMTKMAMVATLAGCATAPAVHEVRRTTVVAKPFDEAWSTVAALITDHGWQIQTIDKSSGIVASEWMPSPPERYLDCGAAPLAIVQYTRGRVNVRLRQQDDRTEVTINAWFHQMRSIGDQYRLVECTSTGVLEGEIQGRIAR